MNSQHQRALHGVRVERGKDYDLRLPCPLSHLHVIIHWFPLRSNYAKL